ncbi:alkyl/aryl-sulfatase [Brevibacterium yomogidense]|uniref:alkyl/aryl-sulfatase n=1 Tax=Brevibacterium yomogidense TaxID=946573 RepID=UPI0018DF94E8|nr:alkyl sulfatase dimerization domain-containing protein [Brevibacterium yomogidense]
MTQFPPLPEDTARIDEDAARGFLGTRADPIIRTASGTVVHDLDAYAFLDSPAPDTSPATLWEHSRRVARHGLFEVCEGIYQVRGFDLANLTLIEGASGVIVLDTLTCTETADAALQLYFAHRGVRPVTGVVLTHPHVDHFGGTAAVLAHAADGEAPVIAPEGFQHHATSENIVAGPAMRRRSGYMYGAMLPVGPDGHVGCGLGQRVVPGTTTLVEPTDEVRDSGETREIDGVTLEFQLTPGTEAPVEMNVFLPQRGALCLAENAVHTLHNIITLRGAQVRDAKNWSAYLDETRRMYVPRTDVAFATHHWPTWGRDRVDAFLSVQRDVYGYMHDQTVRLMNDGLTADEIAEELTLPPQLAATAVVRGFYGSLSHNVKGIYQFYLGWYDGNPSHLWQLPHRDSSRRWIDLLGGTDKAVEHAQGLLDTYRASADPEAGTADSATGSDRTAGSVDDLRFAAELLDVCVFAEPTREEIRELLAQVLELLAHSCENAVWRNEYLTGALELRAQHQQSAPDAGQASRGKGRGGSQLGQGLAPDEVLDSLAVRIDGPAAAGARLSFDLVELDDSGAEVRVHHAHLLNGVLRHHAEPVGAPASDSPAPSHSSAASDLSTASGASTVTDPDPRLTVRLRPGQAAQLVAAGVEGFDHTGDPAVWDRFRALLETPRRRFPIIEPR